MLTYINNFYGRYIHNIHIFVKTNIMEKSDLVEAYTKSLLEEGKRPINVYKFCQSIKIEESEFYQFFGSFEAIEKYVFSHFFEETLKVLKANKEYDSFSTKDKLLSFYFTYIENLTANRSLVLYLLDHKNPIKGLSNIHSIKSQFKLFIEDLDLKQPEIPIDQLREFQEKGLNEVLWGQFLTIVKYWMKDDSPSFEKTDAFIEKSTSVGFELFNFSQLESVIDFGKFILKDTFNKN